MYCIDNYKKEHERIWSEYKEKYSSIYRNPNPNKRSTLIIDGAVNPERYDNILFLLKEAYTDNKSETWDICDWLNADVKYALWNRVAEWAWGIRNTTIDAVAPYRELTQAEKSEAIQSIALVNIKKIYGKPTSDESELDAYAASNQKLLRREIEILQPNIIVCGYTGRYLKAIFGCDFNKGRKRCDNLYYHVDLSEKLTDVTVLDYYHPAAPYPALMSYYGITNIYQQSLKNKRVTRNAVK